MIASRKRALVVAVGAGIAGAVLLGGCTSSHKSTKPTDRPSSSAVSSTAPKPSITPASSIPAPTGNVVTLFKMVKLSSCKAVTGGWTAGGTIHNTSGQSHTYQVLVYFTTNQATVINSAKTTVPVASDQTANWSATAKFKSEPGMRCVVVSVR